MKPSKHIRPSLTRHSQHHRVLLVHHLQRRRRNGEASFARLFRLWPRQFPLRVASCVDNRHIWPAWFALIHVPEYVLDAAGGGYVLLYPQG